VTHGPTLNSDSVYHFCEGQVGAQHAAFGEAVHLAVTLRMQEEASYKGLDPIESEVRRRMFWLLFGGLPSCCDLCQGIESTYFS
jgi:hypothetical protein